MTNIVTNIVHDAELNYPPRPGGMVEQARTANAQVVPETVEDTRIGYDAIRVDIGTTEVFGAQTYVISTTLNPTLRVLGHDSNRQRAVIMTLDEPIVVAASQAAANDNRNASAGTAGNGAGGFLLPLSASSTPSMPFEIKGSGEVWVAATNATATRVSVWAESYADTSA